MAGSPGRLQAPPAGRGARLRRGGHPRIPLRRPSSLNPPRSPSYPRWSLTQRRPGREAGVRRRRRSPPPWPAPCSSARPPCRRVWSHHLRLAPETPRSTRRRRRCPSR
jgi:hypothetical protein